MTGEDFLAQLESLLAQQAEHLQAERYDQAGKLTAQSGPIANARHDRLNRLADLCRRNCPVLAERKAHLAGRLAHSTRGRATLRAYARNQQQCSQVGPVRPTTLRTDRRIPLRPPCL
ncbi:MAG: hypothetical protein BWX88_01731 [Planctomycetes bacterium ADurb.Bin126]|nr:MAG: hypothetical protein BWX88_01731 [Planctomycetes bacterium ADurb.Bin126]HOD82446.1 hypothetical protein [Phycisphaerae bacterium]HQL74766.1 hypothetical protein [Phycisphaerae bacterium]